MVSRTSVEIEGSHLSPVKSTSSIIKKSFGKVLKGIANEFFVPPTANTKGSAMVKNSKGGFLTSKIL